MAHGRKLFHQQRMSRCDGIPCHVVVGARSHSPRPSSSRSGSKSAPGSSLQERIAPLRSCAGPNYLGQSLLSRRECRRKRSRRSSVLNLQSLETEFCHPLECDNGPTFDETGKRRGSRRSGPSRSLLFSLEPLSTLSQRRDLCAQCKHPVSLLGIRAPQSQYWPPAPT